MLKIDDSLRDQLIKAARQAAANSYSPYSKYPVGCALLTASLQIITGCNVENASYGLTMCAERVALFNATSEGHTSFLALAIAGGQTTPAAPCGACRQVMVELCGSQIPIFFTTLKTSNNIVSTTLQELMPHAFAL